jgi:hypothetical protein
MRAKLANSTGGDASLSTNSILHGGQEVDNQTQDPNDELQDTETSPTAPGDRWHPRSASYKRLPPIRCLHPNHNSCSNHRQVCLEDRCVSSLPCIQRSLFQILHYVFEPPILYKVEMNSSLLAYSLSKGVMPHWHQKWPCRRAMSLLKRPILLLLNKVAPPVTCNQCMKPSLQRIHPRLPCKWFPPPFHPVPPRDQSLRMLLKAAWVLLPPSLPI